MGLKHTVADEGEASASVSPFAPNPTRLYLPSFLQLFSRRMSLSVGGYITDKASAARRTSVFFYLPVVVRALYPKNIELNRMEFRIWLVLTEHDGRFSAKASDIPSGTDTGTGF